MQVLIFSGYYLPHVGGAIYDTHTLAQGLMAKGFNVEVVTCNTENAMPLEIIDGIKIIRLPCWNLLNGQFPIPKPSLALARLLFKKPDVISTQTRFFVTSFIGAIMAKLRRIPLVHTERGSVHSVVNNKIVDIASKMYDHIIGSLVISMSDVCIGVSATACQFINHLGGKNIIRIPLGVSDLYLSKKRNGTDNTTIFTGRLVYGKGVQDLLSIYGDIKQCVPEVRLVIVGDGSYRGELEKKADKDVVFTGMKTQAEVSVLLSQASVFVNPSYSEGLPSSVAEAMAVGLPVVAYDVGGTNELDRKSVV